MSIFLFIPNTHNILGFVIQDIIIIMILFYNIFFQKMTKLPLIFLILFILTLFIVMAVYFQRQFDNWLFLARLLVYFSIPTMFTFRLRKLDQFILISVTIIIFVTDYLQLSQKLINPFMFAYYLSARDLEVTFFRYAFFDEHFALTPVLMFVSILLLRSFPVVITVFIAWYFHSRMMVLTLLTRGLIGTYSVLYLLLFVAGLLSMLILLDYRAIEGLLLRFDNWKLHLSCLNTPVDVLFGSSRSCYESITAPIDNFLIRILSKCGLLGVIVITFSLLLSVRTKASVWLMLAFLCMNFVNDLITYPSILLAFVVTLTFVNSRELRAYT